MDEETTRCRLGCCVVAGRTGGRDGEGAVCLGFLMSGSQRFQLKVLDALEIELSRIFLYGPAAGGRSRSSTGFTQPSALDLSHGSRIPGPAFCSRRFENSLDLGVTPLGALEFYLDWT